MSKRETLNQDTGFFAHWLARLTRRDTESQLVSKMERRVLLGAALGLCAATMERGKQLETIMAGTEDPTKASAAYTVYVPDKNGDMIAATHRLGHTEAVTLKPDTHPGSPMLYAKSSFTLN